MVWKMGRKKSPVKKAILYTIIAILIFLLGGWVLSMTNLFGCNGSVCCGRVNGGVSADFTLTVNGTEVEGAYVGNLYVSYMAMSNEFYQFLLSHDYATIDELIAHFNDTYGLDNAYTSYFAWSYIDFEDVRAIFDDSQYDNISINGESFSCCITGVALIPFVSIETFYENGTTYDYFDFALMSLAEIAEITDMEDPFDLITSLPERLIVECGETLSFEVMETVWEEGEDPYTVVNVNGAEIECPAISWFGPW